jgi:hypothetical protein
MTRRSPIRLVPVIEAETTEKKAEEIRKVKSSGDYPMSVLTEGELMGIKVEPRKFIVDDLLMKESIMILNGPRGLGKSWLIMMLANEITWGGAIGPWKVTTPVNVMVVDGEMPMSLIQERMKMLNEGRDIGEKPASLFFYPEAYAYRIGLKRANLLDEGWRKAVLKLTMSLGCELLILDNLSSLAPGIDENDKMPFDEINRWLLELRFHGVTTLMTHHTGKNGEQRGTSAHEDHVDVSLLMKKPNGWRPDQGCRFHVSPMKDRANVTKGAAHTLKLVQAGGHYEFVSEEEGGIGKALRILSHFPNITHKEALEKHGISMKTYYRAKNKIKQEEE